MIVDDCRLICGSANINDRSLLGSRDSELAVCVEGPLDLQLQAGFAGAGVRVNSQVHQYRRSLFREHYGVDLEDPAAEACWALMWSVAQTNTDVYNRVFKVYPSNEYPTFKALKARNKQVDLQALASEAPRIRGHAVLYPYDFLKDEDLMSAKYSEFSMMVVPIYALQ